jgi:hypothetical protein
MFLNGVAAVAGSYLWRVRLISRQKQRCSETLLVSLRCPWDSVLAPNARLIGNLTFSFSFVALCQTKLLSDLPRETERNARNLFDQKQSLFLGKYTV